MKRTVIEQFWFFLRKQTEDTQNDVTISENKNEYIRKSQHI